MLNGEKIFTYFFKLNLVTFSAEGLCSALKDENGVYLEIRLK